jgi:hypothetical protein
MTCGQACVHIVPAYMRFLLPAKKFFGDDRMGGGGGLKFLFLLLASISLRKNIFKNVCKKALLNFIYSIRYCVMKKGTKLRNTPRNRSKKVRYDP